MALWQYVHRHRLGVVAISPADLSFGRNDLILQPDVFVISDLSARGLEWDHVRKLSLVVEVLSPSTSRYDRFTKRRMYQELGVPVYLSSITTNAGRRYGPPKRRRRCTSPNVSSGSPTELRKRW